MSNELVNYMREILLFLVKYVIIFNRADNIKRVPVVLRGVFTK
jgi:hypothetical protein